MTLAPPVDVRGVAAGLEMALARLRAGHAAEARAILLPLAQAHPRVADVRHLLGLASERLGARADAADAYRAAIALDRRRPQTHHALGDLLAEDGDARGAERSLRAALALDRRFAPAAVALATLLSNAGRYAEALQVVTPLAVLESASEGVLSAQAEALKGLGRPEEALAAYRRAAAASPGSAVAEHNVAASCGDLLLYPEAEAAARRAFAKGIDAPETWLVLARAEQGQGRHDAAETAYRQALARRAESFDALRGLSQLIWMRSGDLAAATAPLDAAIMSSPAAIGPRLLKAALCDYAGDARGALDLSIQAAALPQADAHVHAAAAEAALHLDPELALTHAETACALAPGQARMQIALCEGLLACGRAVEAGARAEAVWKANPNNQHALAFAATAWRLLGDPRYGELYDYARFVRAARIDAPPGWSTLSAYLAELKAALERLHTLRAPPIGQSLRQGAQVGESLRHSEEPAIQAFFRAIDAPIRAYLDTLGGLKGPLAARHLGGYAMQGVWSVRLWPGGGRHVDHVHQDGWLSSAFYVDLPEAVDGPERQGWIKFGEPGTPTVPSLGAEHHVKPEPGLLVLFPSYMWHGTTPFYGARSRLTMAFDLVPARPARSAR